MSLSKFLSSTTTRRAFRTLGVGLPVLAMALLAGASSVHSDDADAGARHRRAPDLPMPVCDAVEVPAGHRVSAHLYALGVQIYRWTGSAWEFVAPEAELFAGPCHEASVGLHYAGPIWEARDGSRVLAVREAGCSPYRGAIPWLLLAATESSEHGRFARITFIQRVHTIGGTAPAEPGTVVGEEARVPYTAEYYFYRAMRD